MAVQGDHNTRLRDVIDAINCTYEALARDVRRIAAENGEILQTNKSAISHWVNGTRAPSGRVGQYLAEALSRRAERVITQTEIGLHVGDADAPAESDPVLAVTDLGRADVERHRFLAIAAFTTAGVAMPLGYDHEPTARMLRARTGTSLVGVEDVDVVRQITAAFSAADERLGGGHGLTTVTAYLADTAAPMLRGRFPSEALRRAAFGAVAELAYLAGWKHHDLGQEGAAQRYYQVGYQLACEADPHGHAAWMMRALAHQALSLRQPRHCVDLVEGALRRGLGRTRPARRRGRPPTVRRSPAQLLPRQRPRRRHRSQPHRPHPDRPRRPHRHRTAAPRRPHPLGPREVQARPCPHPRRPRRQPRRPGPR